MANFDELLQHIQRLEEDECYQPMGGGMGMDLGGGREFATGAFVTMSGNDSSMFQTTYDGFNTITAVGFKMPQLQAKSNFEAFLASLKPRTSDLEDARTHKDYPPFTAQPASFFQDTLPEAIPAIRFDNFVQKGIDAQGPGIGEAIAAEDFSPGGTLVLRAGMYAGDFVINKSCTLKADGDVVIQGTQAAFIVGRHEVEVVLDGITISGAELRVTVGKVQMNRCQIASSVVATGSANVTMKDGLLQSAGYPLAVDENAKVVLTGCTLSGAGIFQRRGELSMLRCSTEARQGSALTAEGGIGNFQECRFQDAPGNIVNARGHCTLTFMQCVITDSGSGQLVNAKEGAVVKLKKCDLSGRCSSAIASENGSCVCCEDMVLRKPVMSVTRGLLKLKKCQLLFAYANSGRLVMYECAIQGADGSGVVATGQSDLQIDASEFSACQLAGLELSEETTCTVRGCTFSNNANAGIIMTNVSTTVRDTTFKGGVFGCHATGRNVHMSFKQCTFLDNNTAGAAMFSKAQPKFTKCHFRSNAKFGLLLSNAKGSLYDCEFDSNLELGLELKDGAQCSSEGCTFDSNKKYGCQISGIDTKASFTSCRFLRNSDTSAVILFNKSIAVFTKCMMTESGCFHAEVRDFAAAKFVECDLSESLGGIAIFVHTEGTLELEKCTIKDEMKTAVYGGHKSQSQITDCEISNCRQCGLVFASSSQAAVKGCRIKGNGNVGVQIDGGEVAITGCDFERHAYYGIYAKQNAVISQENNTFASNERGDIRADVPE